MSEDATLDEFLDGGGDGEQTTGDDPRRRTRGADRRDERGGSVVTDDDGPTGSAEAPSAGADDDQPPERVEATSDPPGRPAVDPAVSTHRWHPEGKPCAACGATVTRLWRDDDGLVCGDCKEWRA